MDSKDSSTAPAPVDPTTTAKHAPLAPSQELAYRKKCIALKRRLQEIEAYNDSTRKRIEQERQHIQKMRLNRAILLNHLKTVMESPAKRLTDEQLKELGITTDSRHVAELFSNGGIAGRPDGEALLDDSSEESEEEAEPAERPERRRRTNNYQQTTMTVANPAAPNPSAYQPGLQSIAPAGYPTAGTRDREPAALTSTFQVPNAAAPPPANATPTPQWSYPQPPVPVEQPAYQRASPIVPPQPNSYVQPMHIDGPVAAGSPTTPAQLPPRSSSATQLPPEPIRPAVPFIQFTEHMRPQLEADNYPPDQVSERIQQEWNNLSMENRGLWEKRYEEQMREFTAAHDEYKRMRARVGKPSGSFSESRNKTT